MTYYNGDPYLGPTPDAPLDKFAHDECLPEDQFRTHTFRDGDTLRQQVRPWHWDRVWGAPEPCCYCGKPVR